MASRKTIRLDAYVLDTLMPDLTGHDRSPSSFLVYLLLWRKGRGRGRKASLSLREIAEGTGLSRRTVQAALDRLEARALISSQRESITAVPTYRVHTPWARTARRSRRRT